MTFKRILFVVIINISLAPFNYAIDVSLINLRNIPGIANLEDDLRFVMDNENFLRNWYPDDSWSCKYSKQELADRVIPLATKLDAIEDTIENQDLYLLKGLICYYLFNLDQKGYYDKAIDFLTRIDTFQHRDYRYKWFLGTVYALSIRPFDAIEQFEYVEQRVPEEMLPPYFWEEYAFAAYSALMPNRALNCFDHYSKYGKNDLEKNKLYKILVDSIVSTTVDMEIPKEDLFKLFERKTGIGFLSRPFGIWIPIKEKWGLRYYHYENHIGTIAFKPQSLEDESGNRIGFSIAAFFYVNRDEATSRWLTIAPYVEQVQHLAVDEQFTVFEIRDPEKYKDFGGLHGYVAIFESIEPGDPATSIERPSKIYRKKENISEYTIRPPKNYTRFPGEITYVFLLDSCENIFEGSENEFVNFLQNVIIQ
jgi:hypothetical protein